MLKRLNLSRERAFTLIELLVVILIIGILIAVAAPSFLGQTSKAEDSVAQQNLYNVYISGKSAAWVQNGAYPTIGDPDVNLGQPQDLTSDPAPQGTSLFADLDSAEPEFTFANSVSSTNVNQIEVDEITPQIVYYADQSASGTIFCDEDVAASNVDGSGVAAGFYKSSGTGNECGGSSTGGGSGGTGGTGSGGGGVIQDVPTVVITSPAADSSYPSASAVTVDYSETGIVSSTVCLLDGEYTPCSSAPSGSAVLSGLSDGVHTFEVEVIGPGGTGSAGPLSFTVGTPAGSPPSVTITNGSTLAAGYTAGDDVTIDYSEGGGPLIATPPSTICNLDGNDLQTTQCGDGDGADTTTIVDPTVGTHTFIVTALGTYGTDSAAVSFTVAQPAGGGGGGNGGSTVGTQPLPFPPAYTATFGTAPDIQQAELGDPLEQSYVDNGDQFVSANINDHGHQGIAADNALGGTVAGANDCVSDTAPSAHAVNCGGYGFQFSTSKDFLLSDTHTVTGSHLGSVAAELLYYDSPQDDDYLNYDVDVTNLVSAFGWTSGQTIYWRVTADTEWGSATTRPAGTIVIGGSDGVSSGGAPSSPTIETVTLKCGAPNSVPGTTCPQPVEDTALPPLDQNITANFGIPVGMQPDTSNTGTLAGYYGVYGTPGQVVEVNYTDYDFYDPDLFDGAGNYVGQLPTGFGHLDQYGTGVIPSDGKLIIELAYDPSQFGYYGITPSVHFGLVPVATNTVVPVVSGTTASGDLLSADNGTWTVPSEPYSEAPTSYTYQWEECNAGGGGCGVAADGTLSTYVLTSADIGHTFIVEVTAHNNGGTSSPASSMRTPVIADGGAGPSCSGTDPGDPSGTAGTNYCGTFSESDFYVNQNSVTYSGNDYEALTNVARNQPTPDTPFTQSNSSLFGYFYSYNDCGGGTTITGTTVTADVTYSGTMANGPSTCGSPDYTYYYDYYYLHAPAGTVVNATITGGSDGVIWNAWDPSSTAGNYYGDPPGEPDGGGIGYIGGSFNGSLYNHVNSLSFTMPASGNAWLNISNQFGGPVPYTITFSSTGGELSGGSPWKLLP
jgi:type IV pilus assembly protein PilA